jgi:hypothetical protein
LAIFNDTHAGTNLSQKFNVLKGIITSRQTYLLKESRIIFTCGAADEDNFIDTKRGILMEYAKKNIDGINFFTAEKLFETLDKKNESNLLAIEKKLTNYSDCIIIILESPAAFTELGAFSYPDELSKKILVINDKQFKEKKSFINQGPIDKINNFSEFKNCIWADYDNFADSIKEIKKRINKLTYQNKKSIDISTQEIIEENDKFRFYLLHDLISILYPISHSELVNAVKHIYGDIKESLNFDLALLNSLNMIGKYNSYYIKDSWPENLFLKYVGFNYETFRANYLVQLRKVDSRLSTVASYYEQ